MLITLLLGGMQSDAQAVLARVEQYLKQAKTLSVSVKSMLNGNMIGSSSIVIDYPNRLSFTMKFNGSEVYLKMNETGSLEVDRSQKLYDEFPFPGRVIVPPSRLNYATQYGIPNFLVLKSFNRAFPPSSNPKVTSGVSIGASKVDLIEGKEKGPMGSTEAKAWVDPSGKVLRIYVRSESPEGVMVIQHDLQNYQVNKPIPSEKFSTKLPTGYMPFALSKAGDALETATPIPATKFRNLATAQNIDLAKAVVGKSSLVVFLDPEYSNNAGFMTAVKDLAKKVSGSQTIYISVRKDAASAKSFKIPGILFDPTGTQINKLAIPGAPFVYLTNKSGKVVQAFFGFNGTWEGLGEALDRLKGA